LVDILEDIILSYIYFSENYAFKTQNEVQDMHWYNFQITILVHITYRMNLNFDPTIFQCSWILKGVHYYVSDDKTHDSLFVQHVLILHWEYLKGKECFPKHHVVWSNGCSTQFKSARTWYFIAWYPQLTICEERLEGV
jgi:hypothetical protein